MSMIQPLYNSSCAQLCEALNKAIELRRGGDASDHFFLAMCNWKLEHYEEAEAAYEQAAAWMERNKDALNKDRKYAEELRRFQTEAEEVLEQRPVKVK